MFMDSYKNHCGVHNMYYSFLIIDYAALFIMALCMFVINLQQAGYSQKLMLNVCTWCCFICFGFCIKVTYASSIDMQLLGQKIIYLAFLHALFYMLLFVLNFCRHELPAKLQLLLILNNITFSIFALFMDKHNLFYTSVWLEQSHGISVMRRSYGPLHTVYHVEMILYLIGMLVVIIRNMIKSSRQTKRACMLLIFTLITPYVGYIIQHAIDFPFDFTPTGFILAVIIILELIYVEKIYDVTDIAKDYIFETMDSGYIVTDGEYRYKGCNNLAKQILPELDEVEPDESIYPISSTFRQIVNGNIPQINYNGRLYEPSARRITSGKMTIAIVITFIDVTQQYEYKAMQDSYREELQAEVDKQTSDAQARQKRVEQMSVQLVQTLANAIDAKDKYTNGHSSRVAEYSVRLATALGWDKEKIDTLRNEGLLHDIGKIGISDVILNKAAALSDDEYDMLKDHVTIGYDIMHDASTLPGAANVIRYHHERFDGTGYPNGLKGEQIPLDARIVSIVDTYDAMSSNRIYRKALPKEKIREELLKGRGRQFDPKLLDVFISLFDRGLLDDVAPRDNGWFE